MLIETLLEKLPASPSAPYLRILQRRLLLTTAQPPQGQSGTKSLLAIRAAKLAEMGQTKDVSALIESAPQDKRTNDISILETDALLLENDISSACSKAAINFQTNQNNYWVKTMAFCRMMAKQNDQAMLSLSLLQDTGDNDPTFYRLMEALNAGERPTIDSLPDPKALDLALIRASKAILSETARQTDKPQMLSMLTKAGDINAMQKAAELNIASVDFLREAFKHTAFKPEQLADPINAAQNLDDLQAQALLYQVGTKEGQLQVITSETTAMALELAKENGTFLSISRVYQPTIAKMSRSIDMLWFAPHALRSLLASGDWENAKHWHRMVRNATFTDPEAEKIWTAIRPLTALAGFNRTAEGGSHALVNWWKSQPERPQSYITANRLFSIADGLGLIVPDQLWLALMDGPNVKAGHLPRAGLWIKMNKAAAASRVGETVLLSLLGLSHNKTVDMDSNYLRDTLFALRSVGLERDARAVAVEIILQTGF